MATYPPPTRPFRLRISLWRELNLFYLSNINELCFAIGNIMGPDIPA